MKITILGYGGSGKSTFANHLSNKINIEAIHLDQLFFKENWVEQDKEIFEASIQKVLTKENFIIEGNYSRFGVNRVDLSDKIFIFKFNRFKCLYGVIKRKIKYYKKVRPSAAPGCIEKLDYSFLMWILFKSRTKKKRKYYKDIISKYEDKTVVFTNRRQVNLYLSKITL